MSDRSATGARLGFQSFGANPKVGRFQSATFARTLAAAILALALIILPTVFLPAAAGIAAPVTEVVSPPIDYRERTLPNGLRIFSVLDPTTSNVAVQVWYGVGSKDDPPGRSGFAHLFEHLMFKATRDMPAEYMDHLVEDVGGEGNASTAQDYTNYYEVVPANQLGPVLWAEAERMSSLKVDKASFLSERDVVKEELRQSYLADPYGRLDLATQEASHTLPFQKQHDQNVC